MISVHRPDGPLAHVAWDNKNPLPHEKYEFTKSPVGKQGSHGFQLGVGNNASLLHLLKAAFNSLSCGRIKKPKPGHGRIEHRGIIASHSDGQSVDLLPQIQVNIAIGHAM